MKQSRWFFLLSSVLALLLFGCALSCTCVALVWLRDARMEASSASAVVAAEPTLDLEPVLHQPVSAEHATARLLARSTLPARDLYELAARLQGMPTPAATTTPYGPRGYAVGDSHAFWIHDVQANRFLSATAFLRYETPHAYWWVEEGYDISNQALQRSADRFETRTYPTNHRYFGLEWSPGVDNDPHIYIFLGNVPGVAGYFSSPDEYLAQIRPHSNQHEMFYINLDNAMPGTDYFDGILAHEFQHMIHWVADQDEDTWVNEGLSELAAQVNDYDVGGSDYQFSLAPDTQLTAWSDLPDSGPHYGASYLFLAYFLDQFGEEAVAQLVNEPDNGISAFDAVLTHVDPSQRQFEDLFADWLVANYLDKPNLADGRYGYSELHIEPPTLAARHAAYPVHRQATVHQYAADYIMLEGVGDLTIEFNGSQVVPLVGNETHSGNYQWWSNRGDASDATLTRAFDLSHLKQATLQAWMWYDLETDYDYAYVEVSTDGGVTWTLLANEHTTITNPSGNSYGPGFTGRSGAGSKPRWVLEAFDLTRCAGQPLLIRLEVITDESLNRPGFCVDDIAIPELGYVDDVEDGPGDWQAEGWLRVTDHVPQEFLVQLITIGRKTAVQRMILDAQMHGSMTVSGLGREVERAVLVISALAPVTTERAAYSYRLTQ